MQDAVRHQVKVCAGNLKEGDVLMTNHPIAGGTHLPDITIITPVFADGKPVFFVASRGHHADIGGITPGSMPPHSKTLVEEGTSMPPHSKTLVEEGMCVESFKLVDGGAWQEAGVVALLNSPAAFEGCAAARKIPDNLSDLRAQRSKGARKIPENLSGIPDNLSDRRAQAFVVQL
ncbi:Hydantoinase B/oxoprolinase-domain-containing protein [Baffinella frigidus]|nr:Hydantoinase B/oxoprolinase-domain-containing protein [Cryptophyta sp. CCMP2293]